MSRSEKIIAQCEVAYPLYKGDCVDFAAEVLRRFFVKPDFDGNVLSDKVVADLRRSKDWQNTRSIPKAITAAKNGDLVLAGLRAAELSSEHGHLAVVAGLDGEPSGTVIVPIGFAGSIGGSPISRARLSGTFKAKLVQDEKLDYFIRTPDLEPAASAFSILLNAYAPFNITDKKVKSDVPPVAFGKRVSAEFRFKVSNISRLLGVRTDDLMAVMAFATGETFSPSIRNKQSGATGLIQFMPKTADSLGTTSEKLAAMTAEEQLDYVDLYFRPRTGKLANLGDVYMAVLWPAAIGKPDDWVLFERDTDSAVKAKRYEQNKGLDANKDGLVTRHEASWRVQKMLKKGFRPENFG